MKNLNNKTTEIEPINADELFNELEKLTIFKDRREPKYSTEDIKDCIDDWKTNRCSD